MKDPDLMEKLRKFRMVFVGGAKIDEDLLDMAQDLSLPIAPCYGMTETAAMVTLLKPEDFLDGQRGCGRTLPGVEIEFGSNGQISISTLSLAKGYYGNDNGFKGSIQTQDSGYLDERSNLHVTGRLDRTIITGGENVDPAEVEDVLKTHPDLEEALVLGIPDKDWGQKLVAFVVGKDSQETSLMNFLKEKLPGFKIPKEIVMVGNLPLDARGKVAWEEVKRLSLPGHS